MTIRTCCPTVTQQFSRDICRAVLTGLPSCSARLFSFSCSFF